MTIDSTTSGKTGSVGVEAPISRSWLLVSGRRRHDFDAARSSLADQVVLDIEDGVDSRFKPDARADVRDWLVAGGDAWVRINARETPFWADDVEALHGVPGLRGVVLAKTENAEQVTETWERLGGALPVVALIESALGIEEAVGIAKSDGVLRLAFGSGDYRRDTGWPRMRSRWRTRVPGWSSPVGSAGFPVRSTAPRWARAIPCFASSRYGRSPSA